MIFDLLPWKPREVQDLAVDGLALGLSAELTWHVELGAYGLPYLLRLDASRDRLVDRRSQQRQAIVRSHATRVRLAESGFHPAPELRQSHTFSLGAFANRTVARILCPDPLPGSRSCPIFGTHFPTSMVG
jgi:hypothetical protein